MKKSICILGSTGSIGKSTINLISKNKNIFSVDLLMANSNYKLICEQIRKYQPNYFIINNYKIYLKTKNKFRKKKIKILNNINGVRLEKRVTLLFHQFLALQD